MKLDFKCNNWSLCVMHMFRWVNRTWDHTIKHANRTNREVNTADTRLYLEEDFTILGYFSMYLSLCLLHELLNLSTEGRGPLSTAFHFGRMAVNKENCIWPQSDALSVGKINTALWLATLFKMQKAAEWPQIYAGYWPTRSCPQDTHTHMGMKLNSTNKIWLSMGFFFCIMIPLLSVIA